MRGVEAATLLFGLIICSGAKAASNDDLKKCVAIEAAKSRLDCYDAMAGRPIIPPQTALSIGQWKRTSAKNPIDDLSTEAAGLEASEGTNQLGVHPVLMARCQSNKTEVFFGWFAFLGNDARNIYASTKKVTVRIGSNPAESTMWLESGDHQSTFVSEPIAFLKNLAVADKVVVQITPYNASPITAVFNLAGAREAISPLATACNWKLD